MIRPYKKGDQKKLLELLRLNTPKYFASAEEKDFIEYLDEKIDHYFVTELNGYIVACGGFNYFDENTIRISWDMVHPEHHGKGIGKKLTQFRIEEIKKITGVKTIQVRTSQLAFSFYEKMGFQLEKIEKDFWAEGLDLYLMEMAV